MEYGMEYDDAFLEDKKSMFHDCRPRSPLSPFPIPSTRLLTGNLKARYDLDANTDEVLECCTLVEIDEDAGISFDDFGDVDDNFIVDASCLSTDFISGVTDEIKTHADQIFGVKVVKPRNLTMNGINSFVSSICAAGSLRYLIELNLSYVTMPGSSLNVICDLLNPSVSGYCPIKRLILVRCSLLFQGTRRLLEAAVQNNFLEELILTGNDATDEVIPFLVAFMSFNLNKIKTLGLGSNALSANGAKLLTPVLEKHNSLECLLLNGNPITDAGAEHIFKAIRDKGVLDSLNLSDCGLKSCAWANRLRVMTNLSTLGLGHNQINDEGIQRLATGLMSCICVRNLDLSNNPFGGRLSVILGRLLQQNKLLMSFNLSATHFVDEVWDALAAGLAQNCTLMHLDLSFCDLTLRNAERVCKALELNDSCTVDLDHNPLPQVLLDNPRRYHKDQSGQQAVERHGRSSMRRNRHSEHQSDGDSPTRKERHQSLSPHRRASSLSSNGVDGGYPETAESRYKSDYMSMGGQSSDLSVIKPKQVDPNTAGRSLRLGREWRHARREELLQSKLSLEIMREVKDAEAAKSFAEIRAKMAAAHKRIIEQGEIYPIEAVDQTPSTDYREGDVLVEDDDMVSVSSLGTMSLTSASPVRTTKVTVEEVSIARNTSLSTLPCNTQRSATAALRDTTARSDHLFDTFDDYSANETVNISIGAAKAKAAMENAMAADTKALAAEGGKRVISVAYGHALNVLGNIEVADSTTYFQARDLVRPLIEIYLGASPSKRRNRGNDLSAIASIDGTVHTDRLIGEFVLLDLLEKKPLDLNSSKVRCVWEEALAHEDYLLIVRPGNWIALPPADGENED